MHGPVDRVRESLGWFKGATGPSASPLCSHPCSSIHHHRQLQRSHVANLPAHHSRFIASVSRSVSCASLHTLTNPCFSRLSADWPSDLAHGCNPYLKSSQANSFNHGILDSIILHRCAIVSRNGFRSWVINVFQDFEVFSGFTVLLP